jgi:hypothetical protein
MEIGFSFALDALLLRSFRLVMIFMSISFRLSLYLPFYINFVSFDKVFLFRKRMNFADDNINQKACPLLF